MKNDIEKLRDALDILETIDTSKEEHIRQYVILEGIKNELSWLVTAKEICEKYRK